MGPKTRGGGLTPKGKVAKPTHFVFKSFWISPLIWPSFIQIGEIACVTPAWSSGGLSLKYKAFFYNKKIVVLTLMKSLDIETFTNEKCFFFQTKLSQNLFCFVFLIELLQEMTSRAGFIFQIAWCKCKL